MALKSFFLSIFLFCFFLLFIGTKIDIQWFSFFILIFVKRYRLILHLLSFYFILSCFLFPKSSLNTFIMIYVFTLFFNIWKITIFIFFNIFTIILLFLFNDLKRCIMFLFLNVLVFNDYKRHKNVLLSFFFFNIFHTFFYSFK